MKYVDEAVVSEGDGGRLRVGEWLRPISQGRDFPAPSLWAWKDLMALHGQSVTAADHLAGCVDGLGSARLFHVQSKGDPGDTLLMAVRVTGEVDDEMLGFYLRQRIAELEAAIQMGSPQEASNLRRCVLAFKRMLHEILDVSDDPD